MNGQRGLPPTSWKAYMMELAANEACLSKQSHIQQSLRGAFLSWNLCAHDLPHTKNVVERLLYREGQAYQLFGSGNGSSCSWLPSVSIDTGYVKPG